MLANGVVHVLLLGIVGCSTTLEERIDGRLFACLHFFFGNSLYSLDFPFFHFDLYARYVFVVCLGWRKFKHFTVTHKTLAIPCSMLYQTPVIMIDSTVIQTDPCPFFGCFRMKMHRARQL